MVYILAMCGSVLQHTECPGHPYYTTFMPGNASNYYLGSISLTLPVIVAKGWLDIIGHMTAVV